MATFNFSYAPGTTVQQMVGFETAGRIWASYLTDNVTINLYVGVSNDLPSNVIGGALPGIRASQSYESIRNQLEADATSSDDQAAIKSFQGGKDYKARFEFFKLDTKNGNSQRDYDEAKSQVLNLTRADAKAMGFSLADGDTALDGLIVFGSLAGSQYSWSYDYTRSSLAPANSLDFLSTAIHEIGHILGFVSGVDKPGWIDNTVADKATENAYKDYLDTRVTYTTALDLFRYSDQTLGKNRNDLSYGSRGGTKYFSIDGKTAIAEFSTGKDTNLGGDGSQASHWKSGGIMDPSLAPGVKETLAALDLRAMDVIGWDLAPNATTLNLNLSALVGQSQQALAGRLGQTVSWLNTNTAIAAQSLTQDRSQDIVKMVQDSQIYNWGTTWFNPFRQVVDMMSREEVYSSFQTTTSMCSCTLCGQSANSGFAGAIASPTSKSYGWVGSESSDELHQNSTNEEQIALTHASTHLIRRFVHAIVLNQPHPDQMGTPPAPTTTANLNPLEFSFDFPGRSGSGMQKGELPLPQGQQGLGGERSRYYDSLVRRYSGSDQGSDLTEFSELSFNTI